MKKSSLIKIFLLGLILSVMPFILANYSVDLTAVYQGNNGACEVEPVNGYTLTATGGAVCVDGGINGYSFETSSTKHWANTVKALEFTSVEKLSYSLWINVSTCPVSDSYIYSTDGRNTYNNGLQITPACKIFYQTGSPLEVLLSNSTISLNTWTNIIIVRNSSGNSVKMYINGTLDKSGVRFGKVGDSSSFTSIGNRSWYGGPSFEGKVDELYFWKNRILTQEEVTNLSTGTFFYPFGNPVAIVGDYISPTPINNDFININKFTVNVSANATQSNISSFTFNLWNTTTGLILESQTLEFGEIDSTFANYTFYNLGSGVYTYNVTINNTKNINVTVLARNITVDLVQPYITNINYTPSRVWFNELVTGSFNISDGNLFAYNISINGENISYASNLTITEVIYNLSYSTDFLNPGNNTLSVWSADGHTAKEIKEYDTKKTSKNKIVFNKKNNEISIEPKDITLMEKVFNKGFTLQKEKDRYKFSYEYSKEDFKYSFIVNTEEPAFIVEREDTLYKKWIVSGTNWIDFYSDDLDSSKVKIEYLDDTNKKLEVTVYPKKGNINKKIEFQSFGDLNTNEVNYTLYVINGTFTYNDPVVTGTHNSYNLSFDTTGLPITTLNLTIGFNYNGTTYYPNITTSTNLIKYNVTAISPYVNISSNVSFYWNITLTNHSIKQFNLSHLITPITINVTLKNTETGNVIYDNVSVEFYMLDASYTNLISTTNGSVLLSGVPVGDLRISATSSLYTTSTQLNTITNNNNSYFYTVYMSNKTSTGLGKLYVYIQDEDYYAIKGSDTRLLKYFSDLGEYLEVEQCYSNSNGECVFNINLGTDRYIVTSSATLNGEVVSAQSSTVGDFYPIDNTEIDLFLKYRPEFNLPDEWGLSVTAYNTSLVGNVSYLNAYFIDSNSNSNTVCIRFDYVLQFVRTEVSKECTTGISGTVAFTSPVLLDRNYTYIATIFTQDEDNNVITVYETYQYGKLQGFTTSFSDYLVPIIIVMMAGLLGLSIMLRNITIFPIGMIGVVPISIFLKPTLFNGLFDSMIIVWCIGVLYLARKKSGSEEI